MTRVISVVRVVGFHQWSGAPEQVAYLRALHRHLFTVRVEWVAEHADRAVEFHIAQGWIGQALRKAFPHDGVGFQFGERSCEMIATDLYEQFPPTGPLPCAVECWEDDENGARVEFES